MKIDSIILSWIFTTIAKSLQSRLVDEDPQTAKEAWDLLAVIFQDNKSTRSLALKAELRILKLGDLSIDAYFRKIESIANILKGLGSPMSDEDIVNIAHEGLRTKYDNVCGIIVHRVHFPDLKTKNTPYLKTLKNSRPFPDFEEYVVKMDDPNITMEEYIRLEEEKARRRGKVYNWKTAMYSKIWYDEDVYDLRSVETEFPAIVFNDALTSKVALSYLKMDSENDNYKVNMPSFLSSEPTVSYFDDFDYFKDFENEFSAIAYNDALTSKLDFSEPTISPQHMDEFDETSLFECDDKDNDDDKIDIKQFLEDNVINTDVGVYAQGSNKLLETRMPFIFIIENLYVPFGIPFHPKLFYKDGSKLGQV
ncbi:reverse transcriptase domain-containing protein [Tanacetum coccineum]